jgi:hypothetical protein
VPRIYEHTFQTQPAWVMHWHWFWSTADTLQVFRPPAPAVAAVNITPAVIEALARALVVDFLAEPESSNTTEKNGDER